jgi:hypothetical protein
MALIFDKNYKLCKVSLLVIVSIERVNISGSLQELKCSRLEWLPEYEPASKASRQSCGFVAVWVLWQCLNTMSSVG